MQRRKKRAFLDSGDPKVLVQKFGINIPIKRKRKYLKGVDQEWKFARQSDMPDITAPDTPSVSKERDDSSAGPPGEGEYDEGVIVEHLVASVWMAKDIVSGMPDPSERLKTWKSDTDTAQTCNICMDGFTKVDNTLIRTAVFDYAAVALSESIKSDPSGVSAWSLTLEALSITDPMTGHTFKYSASLNLRRGFWFVD